jgi:hydrogenase maturation protease
MIELDAVVIGYGNELRGDDGLGPFVATSVAAWCGPRVRVQAVHQLTPELAADLARAGRVIFVDACAAAGQAVEVRRLAPGGGGRALSHACDPGMLLNLVQALWGHAPPAWLVTVLGEEFGLGTGLSAAARRRADQAVAQVEALLQRKTG